MKSSKFQNDERLTLVHFFSLKTVKTEADSSRLFAVLSGMQHSLKVTEVESVQAIMTFAMLTPFFHIVF